MDIHGLVFALALLFGSLKGKANSAAAVIKEKKESKADFTLSSSTTKLIDFRRVR